MSAPTLPDGGIGFAVTLPPSWFELDLAPATRDRSLSALVEQRVRDVPPLREHRSTISRLVRRQAREAWDSGARLCACLVDAGDDGPITASITASVVAGPLGVRPGGQDQLEALLAPLAPRVARGEDDTWREVRALDVPDSGPAARAWGVEDVDLPQDAGWVRVVSMVQLAPVPGTDRVVVLSCSSPVLPLAEAFLDLFHAVCDTLRVVRPATPGP